MPALSTVGFEPPADFPQDHYDAIHHRLEHFANSPQGQTWRQFAGAWNAVAYRFQACAEYDESFRSDFARLGVNAGGLDRYRQQRDTYGCIVNACSVIEAFYYAAYAIGSLLRPTDFPITSDSEQRAIKPESATTHFERYFAGDRFAAALRALIDDPSWTALDDMRNVLIHRAAWAKAVVRSAGGPATAAVDRVRLSDYHLGDLDLAPELTSGPRAWVAATLSRTIKAADAFAASNFK
ncbi:MAG TPA: hypothetical protein VNF73_00215 [Candidatus Saccharimonadales bacterium]|nr:hypothetical protein [Candidatus Saccharimonadales bacterium]